MHPYSRHVSRSTSRSISPPIQMRAKGRNACSVCKKAHLRCVCDSGEQSCRRCLSRGVPCSRAFTTHLPGCEQVSSSTAAHMSIVHTTPTSRMQAEHSSGTRHLLPNTWVVQAPLVDEHDQVLQPVFETSIHHAGDNRIHWYPNSHYSEHHHFCPGHPSCLDDTAHHLDADQCFTAWFSRAGQTDDLLSTENTRDTKNSSDPPPFPEMWM